MGRYIFCGIVLLILFLLLCPVSVRIHSTETEQNIAVRYLFFRKTIVPATEKKSKKKTKKTREKKKKTEETKQEIPEENKQEKKTKMSFAKLKKILSAVLDVLPPTGRAVLYFLKKTKIRGFSLDLEYGEEDAAQTGIRFGQLEIILSALYQALDHFTNFSAESVKLTPHFGENVLKYDLSCTVRVRPSVFLGLIRRVIIPYGKLLLVIMKKDGAENE